MASSGIKVAGKAKVGILRKIDVCREDLADLNYESSLIDDPNVPYSSHLNAPSLPSLSGSYFKIIVDDYKLVGKEILQDMSDSPIKASVYGITLAAAAIMAKANPSERDLEDTLINNAQEISLVGAPIRNKNSDKFIDNLRSAQRDGRLHHTSFGLFSCVWISEYRHELDLYEAQCKYTKIPWYQWHRQIVDIGFLGKFIKMSQAMEDYDVNNEEWNANDKS